MTNLRTEQIVAYVKPSTKAKLEVAARRDHRKLSALIDRIVTEWLWRQAEKNKELG